MQLKLKYHQNTGQPVNAAFVQGELPGDWLRQISSWQLEPAGITCYPVPGGIGNNKCVGLLVVFNAKRPQAAGIRHSYTCIGNKLFIPQNAVLYPVVSAEELNKLLLWEVQFFHPTIGLVGFEHKDAINLGSLLMLPGPVEADWSFANPGITPIALLQHIALEGETAERDVMEEIKEDVGSKPLSEIPAAADDGSVLAETGKRSVNFLVKIILLTLLFFAAIFHAVFTLLGKVFGGLFGGGLSGSRSFGGNTGGGSSSSGLFQKLSGWVNQKLEDLEQQRDSELKRLMKMFDENIDEALQYAIPLGSNYFSRGTAAPSSKLFRNPLNFNLGRLGGGGPVDVWNIGNYEYDLRKRYEKSANDAIAKGNFKRAAYIYAHLLNNFHMAANVLQQGKLYREAAAIYKDHLKNERMAAECLEKGGLLSEAIPLYINLAQYEKVGDLYVQLGKEEKAVPYYERTVDILKNTKEYQKAATLTLDKLKRRDDGLNLLLEGWKDTSQPEACLTTYLELQRDNDAPGLPQEVGKVYRDHVGRLKHTSFLNVLAGLNRTYPDEALNQASLNIAYQVIHSQVAMGEVAGLKLISSFLPDDKLINADATRFIQGKAKLPPVNVSATYLQLRKDTEWYMLTAYHDQLLGVGAKQDGYYFVRANWDEKVNYHFLCRNGAGEPVRLLADAGLSNQALVVSSQMPAATVQNLESHSYFGREVWLRAVNWMPAGLLGCCLNGENGVSVVHLSGQGLMISHFNLDGELLAAHHLDRNEEKVSLAEYMFGNCTMAWRKDHFYIAIGDKLLRLSKEAIVEVTEAGGQILKFAISAPAAALKIAVLTEDGCLIVTPLYREMKVTTALFAQDVEKRNIELMTDHRLVISGEKSASVYELNGNAPILKSRIQTDNAIVRIIAIPKRHHCAFLESDGRVSVYQLEGWSL